MAKQETNQRDHFRLEYPSADRPTLALGGVDYAVADMSEKGLRLVYQRSFPWQINAPVRGIVTFRDGKTCEIVGTVHRIDKEQAAVVLLLTQGVPLAKMHEEHRFLLQKYAR